jgi:ribonuclease III
MGDLELAARDPLSPVVQPDRVTPRVAPPGSPRQLAEVEQRLGHRFLRKAWLREALTHGSMIGPGQGRRRSNERLEFLGDRVIGLAVAELLISRYPHEPEGALTPRMAVLVSEPVLAAVARELGLGAWLEVSRSEEEGGGRERPAILADGFEALIGAIYLDGGWEAAAGIVRRCIEPRLETMAVPPRDAKSRLQEWTQSRGLGLPAYRVMRMSGPDHAPIFEIAVSLADVAKVTATGSSKRAAEQAAAERLLEHLAGETEAP